MLHIVLSKTTNSDFAEILHRPIRSLTFPEDSSLGVSIRKSIVSNNRFVTIDCASYTRLLSF